MKFKLPKWFERQNPTEILTVADASSRAEAARADLANAKNSATQLRAKFIESRDPTILESLEQSTAEVSRLELLLEVVEGDLVKAQEAEAAAVKAAKEAKLHEIEAILAADSEAKKLAQVEAEAILAVVQVRLRRCAQHAETSNLEHQIDRLRFELGLDVEYGGGRRNLFIPGSDKPSHIPVVEALKAALAGTKGTEHDVLLGFVHAMERGQL